MSASAKPTCTVIRSKETYEACLAVVARTDPNEQESVVLLPELDARAGVEEIDAD